jgi:hypothetical protein
MRKGAELHTIEASHGKPRLTQPRPTDLGTVATEDERARDRVAGGKFAPGNKAAAGRTAKRALTAPLRAARKRLQEAGEAVVPSDADALLSDAMAVYASARLELGSASVFVLGPTVAFATETVLAGYFAKQAATAGFETERGLELLDAAHRCETQAQRAMTAALAAMKALPKRGRAARVIDTIEAEAAAGDDE